MSKNWRRFEVLIPLQFNDGREVPARWISEAFLEVRNHFGSATYETQRIEGHWLHRGVFYKDYLTRIVVDVADSPDNRVWMKGFKERLRIRLEQIELWVVSYPIEVE
jgi:hypothetical protein